MNSREQILNKLKSGLAGIETISQVEDIAKNNKTIDSNEFIKQLKLANADVRLSDNNSWQQELAEVIAENSIKTLTASAQKIEFEHAALSCKVVDIYKDNFNQIKAEVFEQIDASLTTVAGAICETGTLILIPDVDEPRTVSLVPPIHIALVYEDQLLATFSDFVTTQDKGNMPTNIVLVTGPSKTADIQQTIAFGAHGPKKLVVIYCQND